MQNKKIIPPVLSLILPDWSAIDTVFRSEKPFFLWPIGDQPLIYHWLDYALNQGYKTVNFYAQHQLGIIDLFLSQATLWPLQLNLETGPLLTDERPFFVVDHLPGSMLIGPKPQDGWSLLAYWMSLNNQWLDIIQSNVVHVHNTCIGRFCFIHETVELRPPFWIGHYVHIGPHSRIGPYAFISDHCVLEGPSTVDHALMTSHTFLTGHTRLRNALLAENKLFNLQHQGMIDLLDSMIAGKFMKSDE